MGRLRIERLGGLAGFGGPHLKAKGEIAMSSLSPTDKQAVEDLFKGSSRPTPKNEADGFRYRITRETEAGPQVIEVPAEVVPPSVKETVHDTLE